MKYVERILLNDPTNYSSRILRAGLVVEATGCKRCSRPTTAHDLPGLVDAAAEQLPAALHRRCDELTMNDLCRAIGSLDRLIARAADVTDHLSAQLPSRHANVAVFHDGGDDPAGAVAAIVGQLEHSAHRLRTTRSSTDAHNTISHLGERYTDVHAAR